VKLLEQLGFVTITIPKDNNGFVGKTQYPKCKQGRVAKSFMTWEYMNKQKNSHLTKLEL
jgi:hypothetical protein